MTGEQLIFIGLLLAAGSGVPSLFFGRHSFLGPWLANLLLLTGSGYGFAGVAAWFGDGVTHTLRIPSPIAGTDLTLGLDALSVVFLLPILLVASLGSIYGMSYWKQSEHPENGRKLRLFYGLLFAALVLLVTARDWVLFLIAWEIMAVANFFLVATDDHDPEVRQAGWLYLGSSHLATLGLFALFPLMAAAAGTFEFRSLHDASPAVASAIFLLALASFGLKAGVMPLHFWLPSAHANAPSHVSALMSGVIIKVGVYGLVRVCALLPLGPVWWGGLTLALGAISGVLGVAFAIGQHDLKRLLAYHSIENIGIIVMGIGLALIGRSLGRVDWVVLGLAGALLHVWNHALFKSLLFLCAGSVIHAAHTREIDHLGGLARRMPWTAFGFLVGAVAICGLPPLNGFVSEWLVYLGLFRTFGIGAGPSWSGAAFAVPALALIGTLAVACFVKVYGAVFLGVARTGHAGEVHEAGPLMIAPMLILAGCCIYIGLAPDRVAPVFDAAIVAWRGAPSEALDELAPLAWISAMGLTLVGALGAGAIALGACLRREPVGADGTWGCGYLAPTPRMQYTASSFGEMLVGLFGWALRPKEHVHRVAGWFPAHADFHSEVNDTVLDGAVAPGVRLFERVFAWSRFLQQGRVQAYLLYILAMVVILLLWV